MLMIVSHSCFGPGFVVVLASLESTVNYLHISISEGSTETQTPEQTQEFGLSLLILKNPHIYCNKWMVLILEQWIRYQDTIPRSFNLVILPKYRYSTLPVRQCNQIICVQAPLKKKEKKKKSIFKYIKAFCSWTGFTQIENRHM